MKKSFLELQCLEEKKLNEEIKKIDNAEQYYKMLSMFNSLSLIFFVMNIFVIILAVISQSLLLNISDNLFMMLICSFVTLAFISLLASTFYKHKTMEVLKQHYEAN